MMDDALVAEFDQEMHHLYKRTFSEVHYNATQFLRMLYDHGGLETARILLHSAKVSDGYTALYQRHCLRLTVEAVIHDNPKWHPLFTDDELAICTKRLRDYEYLK